MSLDNLLRDCARQDLQRLCPQAHYWLRDHDPKADRELVEPLLREPARFGLTPRERVAATALGDLATYEIRSRDIWTKAFPARDLDDLPAVEPMTLDQEREIYGRREVFRRSALVYARMLNDVQLIEHYQCETPIPGTQEVAPTDEVVNVVPEPGRPRAYWRQLLRDHLAEIDRKGAADVVSVIRALKRIGDRRIPNKGTHEELYYLDEYGNEKLVLKKTVSNSLIMERKTRQ